MVDDLPYDPSTAAVAIDKLLSTPGGSMVLLAHRIDETELLAERAVEAVRVVARDLQTAAVGRAVEREGGDDDVASRFDGPLHSLNVAVTIGGVGQEVENGAIVPEIIGM